MQALGLPTLAFIAFLVRSIASAKPLPATSSRSPVHLSVSSLCTAQSTVLLRCDH